MAWIYEQRGNVMRLVGGGWEPTEFDANALKEMKAESKLAEYYIEKEKLARKRQLSLIAMVACLL